MINRVARELHRAGVDVRFLGDRVYFARLPSWRHYRLAKTWSRDLAAVAYIKELFAKPLGPIPYKPGNARCGWCIHLEHFRCRLHPNEKSIPPKRWQVGCSRWVENGHLYF